MDIEKFFANSYDGSKQYNQQKIVTANATGFGAAADDYAERGIDLNEQLIGNKPSTFFMRIAGNAMQQAGITTGDIIIIDKSLKPQSGKIIVAVVEGEMLLRRYEKTFNKVFLIAEAAKTTKMEITEYSDFKVWGVVTWILKNV